MKTRLQDRSSYRNIFAYVIVALAILRSGKCSTNGCDGYSSLGDARRTTTEDPGTCGGICDNNIIEDLWYRLDESNSGARMPESSVEVWHCGTYIPIWLKGVHPTVENQPTKIPVCAQLRVGGPLCEWQSEVTVQRCNDGVVFFVYQLKKTPYCDMAYCAGNGINCAGNGSYNDIAKSCVNPPTPPLNANPVLSNPYISAMTPVIDDKGSSFKATRFSMNCTLDYPRKTTDDGARYDVIFQANGQVVYTSTLHSTDPPVVVMSESYLVGRAGQTVICKATSYWQSQFPTRSSYQNSNSYTFDIYFMNDNSARQTAVTISEGTTMRLRVTASFPITTPSCFNLPEGSPCYPYYTFSLSSSALRMSVYTFRLATDTKISGGIWISSVPDIGAYGKNGNINYQIDNSDQGRNSIFGSDKIFQLPATIIDPTPWQSCTSCGDPHITTFAPSTYYHVYMSGDFVLLKVPSKQIEVHVRLTPCNGNTISCNCGVIAREGNNILGINACGSSLLTERYRYEETNPGGSITYQGGNQWIITLPSGLLITAGVFWPYMNIIVDGNGIDIYSGMCTNSLASQCYNCLCTDECDRTLRVSGSASLFSYSRSNPPPCNENPPIVPQWECARGASNPTCTSPDTSASNLVPSARETNKCNKASSKRKRQLSSSDSQVPSIAKRYERSTPNTEWPTKSGITEQNAFDACNSNITLSPIYSMCVGTFHVNASQIIATCMLDIQILDDINYSPSYVATLMELVCKSAIGKADNGTQNPAKDFYVENVCPKQCSQHGSCSNGQCTCAKGYMSEDCSVKEGQVPEILNLRNPTCDVRLPGMCRTVQLDAAGVSSDHPVCKFRNDSNVVLGLDMTPSVTGPLMTCNVPLLPVMPDISFGQTVTSYTVYVSLSNSATSMNFGNEMKFIVYNGLCVSCNSSSGCTIKDDACGILGRCYESGAVMYCGKNNTDPRVCKPTISNTKWLPINSVNKDQGSETCSSTRPAATAAILLFSYIFITLINKITFS